MSPLALDTDVLVHWVFSSAPFHRTLRRLVRREVRRGGRLAITPQVLWEFLHVATDRRRFERPMPMRRALRLASHLWRSAETVRVLPGPTVPDRTCELMSRHRLGRRRILDTALAATLESAGVRRLATLNPRDFEIFNFLDLVGPGKT